MIPLALGNPNGGEIRHGSGEIFDLEAGQLTIDQFSDKLIIDWEEFSIDHGELTRFVQPGKDSAALNRVFSGNPSSIHGRLEANGNVWLINPNGVLIGPGGSVKANGFVASSLDVSDEDFLSGGEARFAGGSSAAVQNLGSIEALGGDVFLIAREVSNDGSIKATQGTVGLAAGSEVVVAPAGEERVAIAPGGEGSVQNSGTIEAARAELKAAGGNAYALAINNTGMVRAQSFQKRGGRLYLSAGGGKIVNTGSMRASKSVAINSVGSVESVGSIRVQDEETGNGGDLVISADQVRILGPADTSGLEGGSVTLSGSTSVHVDGAVKANGTVGNGGEVTLTSPDISLGVNADVRADGAAEGGTVLAGLDPRVPSVVGALEAVSVRAAAGSRISANGGSGAGGQVLVFGSQDGEIRLGGAIRANSSSAAAGDILVLGGDVFVDQTADLRANGETDGGTIQIGGEGDVRVAGRMEAKGSTGDGGFIHAKGENVVVTQTGRIDASGAADGGFVHLEGGDEGTVSVAGTILAKGKDGDGGMIHLQGGQISVSQTGLLDASGGSDGGFIHLEGGESVEFSGTARAVGGSGDGGMIQMTGENVTVTQTGVLDASGAVDGGVIHLEGSESVQFDGTALATGGEGAGGRVTITGEEVALGTTALVNASGTTNGGQILVGGGKQGRDASVRNARNTSMAKGARLIANGGEQGGEVVLWADGITDFRGSIEAAGQNDGVTGGFAEVSGLEGLNFAGEVNTGGGDLLLDPFNYTIGVAEAVTLHLALLANNVTIDTRFDVGAHGSSGNSADAGDITVNSDLIWGNASSLTFLAQRDIHVNALVQNNGAGDVNFVAGWNGLTAFDAALFEGVALSSSLFGQGDAAVNIGDGAQPMAVAVGSRSGTTRVYTHDLNLSGSNLAGFLPGAQLGYIAQNEGGGFNVDGDISVRANGALRMLGGNATDAYTQIGHLGPDPFDPTVDGTSNGAINLEVAEDISLIPGGFTSGASSQIGHGGRGTAGTFNGSITIERAQNLILPGSTQDESFTQIGGGGLNSVGNANVPININADNVIMTSGTGINSYSLIGSGGTNATGNHSGDINVTTSVDLTIAGDNTNTDRFGGIGNGDQMGDDDTGQTVSGDINLRVGNDFRAMSGIIGNRVDPSGIQTTGNTYVGVSQALFTTEGAGQLLFDANTIFSSEAAGELRFYVPKALNYQGAAGALLNGVAGPAPGTDPLPNDQGMFPFGLGGYT
ncbi:MAG: filamentous hemagglutinin N-terminal domain-containing protein, partial [Verrucomicrobiota bacterium]